MRVATPRRRSVSLTHTIESVQPAARRSQTAAARRIGPRKASNDQPCGWKRVGSRRRRARRPARPALEECRCTRSGSSAAISRASDRVSSSAPGPGERFASQASNRAPVFMTAGPSAARDGPATTTSSPRSTWSRASCVTTAATPPSPGWETCKTREDIPISLGAAPAVHEEVLVAERDGTGAHPRSVVRVRGVTGSLVVAHGRPALV